MYRKQQFRDRNNKAKLVLTVCYYHVTYAFQSECTLCLNVKGHLDRNRHHIWNLSDSNEIWTQNHLVRERTLNYLAKLAKWLSCVVSNHLYNAFGCMSCSIQISTHNTAQSFGHLPKRFSAHLWTKWLWVRISLLSLKLQIWRLLRARSCLTFRQL